MTLDLLPMKKDPNSVQKVSSAALEKAEKGSHRSMWELLLQLRVLLPYLARLVPLLEPLLDRASAKPSDLPDISGSITALQTGNRDLEVQARNQTLRLERIEQELGRLRLAQEQSLEQNLGLTGEIRKLRQWLTIMGGSIVVLLLMVAGMIGFLASRS
jgi:hypothetical protein